jgi:hypothetical protein
METTWEIVAQDGQFLVVEYTRGGAKIRLQILPPVPKEDESFEEALATSVRAHEPRAEQFEAAPPPDLSDLIGTGGSTSTPGALPT